MGFLSNYLSEHFAIVGMWLLVVTFEYTLKDDRELIDVKNSDFVNFINWLKEFSK